MTPSERASLVRWRAALVKELKPPVSDRYRELFTLAEPLLRDQPGRVLTLEEVRALPQNAIIRVIWGGGNGPHLYRVRRAEWVDGPSIWVTTLHAPWLELKDPLLLYREEQINLLDHVELLEF